MRGRRRILLVPYHVGNWRSISVYAREEEEGEPRGVWGGGGGGLEWQMVSHRAELYFPLVDVSEIP
jgi:hypothetical protein